MWTLISWKSNANGSANGKIWRYILIRTERRLGVETEAPQRIAERVQQIIESSIPLIGIIIFYILGLAQDLLGAMGTGYCFKAFEY